MKINLVDADLISKTEKKFLLLLEDDKSFEELVGLARKACLIPAQGLEIKLSTDNIFTAESREELSKVLVGNTFTMLTISCSLIRIAYNLPVVWERYFFTIILANAAVGRKVHEEKVELEISMPESPLKSGPSMIIKINEQLTIEQITSELLKKHKAKFDKLSTYLPSFPTTAIQQNKNYKAKKAILSLERQGQKAKKISQELEKLFPDLSFDPTIKAVENYSKRYKKKLSSLLKNQYIADIFNELIENQ